MLHRKPRSRRHRPRPNASSRANPSISSPAKRTARLATGVRQPPTPEMRGHNTPGGRSNNGAGSRGLDNSGATTSESGSRAGRAGLIGATGRGAPCQMSDLDRIGAATMGQSGAFDDVLASFAMAYAVRTQKDYDQLAKSKRKAA